MSETVGVLVFTSGDPDYFISHVAATRIDEYRAEAAKPAGESSLGLPELLAAPPPG